MEGIPVNLEPDGTLGAILASEGLGATDTLINGAGGCRSRSQMILRDLLQSYEGEDERCCESRYHSKQSRLPCTFMNGRDVVFGTENKLVESIRSVSGLSGRNVAVIDTLGASFVCADQSRLPPGTVNLDQDLSGLSFCQGYDDTMRRILSSLDIDGGECDGATVNILGYGIHDLGWEYGVAEIGSLLSTMGVRVNAFVGCRPTMDGVRAIGSSDLNIMIHPEYCLHTARYLRNRFGTPFLRPAEGCPVGYSSTESFLKEIGDELDLDAGPALDVVRRDESRVRDQLMNNPKAVDSFRRKGFSADGDSSTVLPLVKWMIEGFSMVPRSIRLTDDEYVDDLREYLREMGFDDALGSNLSGGAELSFTDGMTCAYGNRSGVTTSFVEVRIPFTRPINLTSRCMVGTRGCRYILDEMMNMQHRFRCGQPMSVDMR